MSYIGRKNLHCIERFGIRRVLCSLNWYSRASFYSSGSFGFWLFRSRSQPVRTWSMRRMTNGAAILCSWRSMRNPLRPGTWVDFKRVFRNIYFSIISLVIKIPFPAITICPESKTNVDLFNLSEVLNLVNLKKPLNRTQINGLDALYQICNIITEDVKDSVSLTSIIVAETNQHRSHRFQKANFITTLRRLKNNFAYISSMSIANEKFKPLREHFREIITEEGVCQTFNMLDEKDLYKKTMSPLLRYPRQAGRSNWTSFGYKKNDSAHTHPMRILGAGKKAGITIQLEMRKIDIDYACKETSGGFRLTLLNFQY